MALDNTDTTALTVTGCGRSFHIGGTGNVTLTDKLATLTASTSTASGTVQLGSVADADSLTTINLTSANANLTVGVIGTDSTNAGNAEVLSTITMTATGSSTIDIDDIFADDNVNSTTDNAMTITMTTETGSTITTGEIDNAFGSITVTASGDGTHNIGNAVETLTAVTQTIDLSAATGTNLVGTVGVTGYIHRNIGRRRWV